MNKKVKITLGVIGCAIAAGLAVCVGIYAYKHRVVEVKCFPAIATIDAHDYRPPYTTYTTHHNKGVVIRTPHHHPAKYYLHYTVDFEGGIYADNQENVEAAYFHRHKDGDKVDAVFEKQWRADGSETYRIYLDR